MFSGLWGGFFRTTSSFSSFEANNWLENSLIYSCCFDEVFCCAEILLARVTYFFLPSRITFLTGVGGGSKLASVFNLWGLDTNVTIWLIGSQNWDLFGSKTIAVSFLGDSYALDWLIFKFSFIEKEDSGSARLELILLSWLKSRTEAMRDLGVCWSFERESMGLLLTNTRIWLCGRCSNQDVGYFYSCTIGGRFA